jgi:hypothetical protein
MASVADQSRLDRSVNAGLRAVYFLRKIFKFTHQR